MCVTAANSNLEQVAQGGCGCPIPAGIQGQAGCGSGQPGLLVGDPAHSRGLKSDDHCGPFQPRPFYDSNMNCVLACCITGKKKKKKKQPKNSDKTTNHTEGFGVHGERSSLLQV